MAKLRNNRFVNVLRIATLCAFLIGIAATAQA